MKAARLHGPRDLRIEEMERPTPGPGEALIRIGACGVCPSDIRGFLGTKKIERPTSPGHEWAGVIEAVGPALRPGDDAIQVGDRVVVDWRILCGRCYQCRRGNFGYCEALKTTEWGGFAEYGLAPISQLRVVPDSLSLEEASFCEPLACIVNAHAHTEIPIGGDVVVLGVGPIGLLHLQLANRRCGRVIAVDRISERLQAAKSLGAHDLVDASTADAVKQVRSLTAGRGADAVIIAVGGQGAIQQGIDMAAINGWVNIFAGTHPAAEMPFDPNLVHYRQLRITGSHDYTPDYFSTALKLMEHGIVDVNPLISHRFELSDLPQAFEMTAGHRGLKSVVLPNGTART
jgi:L-iditol 2-dehydrogenase